MKTKILPVIICAVFTGHAVNSNAQADQQLSNLIAPTAVNVSLQPDQNAKRNLGSTAKSWNGIYFSDAIYYKGDTLIRTNGTSFFAGINAGTANFNLFNTGIGTYTLNGLTTGGYNTAIGYYDLFKNTTGDYNTATGYEALYLNITGNNNVANGFEALSRNSSGNNNVAVGLRALYYNTDFSGLVAVGDSALFNLNSLNGGSGHCTAVGEHAGLKNTSGGNNSYFGYHAGNTVTTGSSNTILGYGADVSNGTFTNATAIGNLAVSGASNRIRIGNGSVTSIGGAVGWTNFSDERIKTNIKENVPGLAFINLLKPVTYNFDLTKEEQIFKRKDSAEWKEKYDIQKIKFTGFLAQEVETAAQKINYNFSGVDKPASDNDVYGLRYSDFVVPLVKAVQELSKLNDDKDRIIQTQNNKIENLETRLVKIETMMNVQSSSIKSQQQKTTIFSPSLQQNIPNPFSNSTTISYSLPQTYSSAKIIVTDKNGNTLKQINLSGNKGSVTINASTLSSGAYQYSLYVDGKLIASKQFVVTK